MSDEDYERVAAHKWSLSYSPKNSPKMYAVCKINGKQTGLHRFVLGMGDGGLVDHRDGDGLNNQRSNLRKCTYGQNRANSDTKRNLPKGVYARRQRTGGTVYRAQIRHDNRLTNLGTYTTIEEAAAAYAKAAPNFHGEFARME